MFDSHDSKPEDSSGASRGGQGDGGGLTTTGQGVPARGLVGPRSPSGSGSGQQGSYGRQASGGTRQQADGDAPFDDDNDPPLPSARETARTMERIARACATGFMDPAQARATASILKDSNQVRFQQEEFERRQVASAAAAQRSAPNGFGVNDSGEPADRPSPGAPRMVPAGVIDAAIEVAMAHQPQLLRDLEPVLDDEQLDRVAEFLSRRMGPGEPEHGSR